MKKNVFLFSLLIIFASCSKKDSEVNENTTTEKKIFSESLLVNKWWYYTVLDTSNYFISDRKSYYFESNGILILKSQDESIIDTIGKWYLLNDKEGIIYQKDVIIIKDTINSLVFSEFDELEVNDLTEHNLELLINGNSYVYQDVPLY